MKHGAFAGSASPRPLKYFWLQRGSPLLSPRHSSPSSPPGSDRAAAAKPFLDTAVKPPDKSKRRIGRGSARPPEKGAEHAARTREQGPFVAGDQKRRTFIWVPSHRSPALSPRSFLTSPALWETSFVSFPVFFLFFNG